MKTQFCIFILFLALGQGYTQSNLLQYHAPARYFEEALPIGNGKQGAMIYSGIDHDRLSLNDITLWSGEPYNPANNPDAFNYLAPVRKALFKEDYAAADTLVRHIQGKFSEAYQPLGNLMIHLDQNVNDVQNFTRTVDLDKALVKSEYQIDDTKYTKSYFASYPDKLIVINIAAQGSKKLNGSLSFNSPHPNKVLSSAHELFMTGRAPVHSEPNYNRTNNPLIYVDGHGTRFAARLNVLNENGSIALSDTSIIFKDCNSLEIRLSLATSFNGYNKDPFTQGLDELKISSNQLVNAKKYSYTQLISRHQKNYSSLYDRVRFQLGENNAGKDDTYHRLKDNTDLANDLSLINLYFNFGRYLLISSSRTSHVPINLQGLWNEAVRPPWSSNYTININTEMNYWPIETCNLSELHQPLLSFLGDLSKTGTITASTYYHTRGWTAHHNSDIWAMSNPVGNFGKGSPQWANWAMGGAWLSTHIWEHYLFTKDKKYLTNSYDILKNQCRFLLDFLVKDTYGHLVTAPSTSPENVYMNDKGFKGATMYGGTSDLALIRQVFNNTILAANELKRDPAFKDSLSNALVQLSPYKISSQGWLQEWYCLGPGTGTVMPSIGIPVSCAGPGTMVHPSAIFLPLPVSPSFTKASFLWWHLTATSQPLSWPAAGPSGGPRRRL